MAEDFDGKIVGYVLAKMEEDDKLPKHGAFSSFMLMMPRVSLPRSLLIRTLSLSLFYVGHITSLSVLRTHRKRGIATALMRRSQKEMEDVFQAEFVSLHVRKSNRAAFHLYKETLQYEINDVEKGYYADGEDAYDMRCTFKQQDEVQDTVVLAEKLTALQVEG